MADWTLPPDLEKFLGLYTWETQLSDRDRYRLAVTRSFVTDNDVETIALEHAQVLSSSEFRNSLDETKDDPPARAVVRLEAELDNCPFRVSWDAESPAEMQLIG